MENGWRTPTGKIELYSEVIGAHPEWGLNPLPSYTPPINPNPEKYPFMLCSGARLPNVLHSRLHGSPWQRSLLPDPTVEMNPVDCEKLGIEDSDIERFSQETFDADCGFHDARFDTSALFLAVNRGVGKIESFNSLAKFI